MTNEEIITKMKEDMKMRGFSYYTEDSYLRKAKDVMKYFGVRIDIWTHLTRECIINYVH